MDKVGSSAFSLPSIAAKLNFEGSRRLLRFTNAALSAYGHIRGRPRELVFVQSSIKNVVKYSSAFDYPGYAHSWLTLRKKNWLEVASLVCFTLTQISGTLEFLDEMKWIHLKALSASIGRIPIISTILDSTDIIGILFLTGNRFVKVRKNSKERQSLQKQLSLWQKKQREIKKNFETTIQGYVLGQKKENAVDQELSKVVFFEAELDQKNYITFTIERKIEVLTHQLNHLKKESFVDQVSLLSNVLLVARMVIGITALFFANVAFLSATSPFMITLGLVSTTISAYSYFKGKAIKKEIKKDLLPPLNICLESLEKQLAVKKLA